MSKKKKTRPFALRPELEMDQIVVRGAREHNLKDIDISLPKKRFIVFTGVSGSGKSSLAFDTIFAEGQRRYVESLSSYARQFIGQMDKPHYDTIRQGAVIPWKNYFNRQGKLGRSWGARQLKAMKDQWGFDFDMPWRKLPKSHKEVIMFGSKGKELNVHWDSEKIQGNIRMTWEGLVPTLMRRYRQTQSEHQKKYYAAFMSEKACHTCHGLRLRPEVLEVRIVGQSIVDVTEMTIGEATH